MMRQMYAASMLIFLGVGCGDDDPSTAEVDPNEGDAPIYALCGTSDSPEGPVGWIGTSVGFPDTFDALGSVLEFPGGLGCGASGTSVFVGLGDRGRSLSANRNAGGAPAAGY